MLHTVTDRCWYISNFRGTQSSSVIFSDDSKQAITVSQPHSGGFGAHTFVHQASKAWTRLYVVRYRSLLFARHLRPTATLPTWIPNSTIWVTKLDYSPTMTLLLLFVLDLCHFKVSETWDKFNFLYNFVLPFVVNFQ